MKYYFQQHFLLHKLSASYAEKSLTEHGALHVEPPSDGNTN